MFGQGLDVPREYLGPQLVVLELCILKFSFLEQAADSSQLHSKINRWFRYSRVDIFSQTLLIIDISRQLLFRGIQVPLHSQKVPHHTGFIFSKSVTLYSVPQSEFERADGLLLESDRIRK